MAQAAAYALGAIGSPAAAKVLVTAKPAAATRVATADAALACADNLLAGGNKAAAKATYDNLLGGAPSKLVQQAATRGAQACAAK